MASGSNDNGVRRCTGRSAALEPVTDNGRVDGTSLNLPAVPSPGLRPDPRAFCPRP